MFRETSREQNGIVHNTGAMGPSRTEAAGGVLLAVRLALTNAR